MAKVSAAALSIEHRLTRLEILLIVNTLASVGPYAAPLAVIVFKALGG